MISGPNAQKTFQGADVSMFVIIPHLDTWSLCSEHLPWGVQEDGRRINKQDAGRCKFEMLLEHDGPPPGRYH